VTARACCRGPSYDRGGIERRASRSLVEEAVTDVEGFSSGSHDTSVLRDFENHIALRV